MMDSAELLTRRLDREKRARKEAESLLEEKSRQLYQAHRACSTKLVLIEQQALEERRLREKIVNQRAQLLQSDKMASIGQLAAGVAHEINNPIGFVSSNFNTLGKYFESLKKILTAYSGLLESTGDPASDAAARAERVRHVIEEEDLEFLLEDIEDLLRDSVEGIKRVRDIAADLRDFSHVDRPDFTDEDLGALIDRTLNVAWNEVKHKAEVVKEYSDDAPMVHCNGGQLGQVLLNFFVNAAQAIDGFGKIVVRTGREGEEVWVEIQDTGCGIAPEHVDRIFDPFFTTKEIGEGTGLGLHVNYKIVRAHGGSIEVASEPGVGSTFRIRLPIDGPQEEEIPNDSAA